MANTLDYQIAKSHRNRRRIAFQISVVGAICGLWAALNFWPPFASHFFVVDNGISTGFPFTFSSIGDYVYRYSFSRLAVAADVLLGAGVAVLSWYLSGRCGWVAPKRLASEE